VSALAEALVAAQAELPCAIGKDADGQIGTRSYRYLTLDKLIAETRPILQRHGLTIMQWPSYIERGDDVAIPALTTVVMLAGADDSKPLGWDSMSWTMPLYLTDKTMQGLGSAITYARRYAWQSVLGIAAEEDTDGPAIPGMLPEEDVPF
jgi:ERF superfamily